MISNYTSVPARSTSSSSVAFSSRSSHSVVKSSSTVFFGCSFGFHGFAERSGPLLSPVVVVVVGSEEGGGVNKGVKDVSDKHVQKIYRGKTNNRMQAHSKREELQSEH